MEGFQISPAQLALLTVPGKEEENLKTLETIGGGPGICAKLLSDAHRGVSGSPEDLAARRKVFGENKTRVTEIESWLSLFLECFKDPILIILLVAASVSLIVNTIHDPHEGFVDGLAIFFAVALVATVTATNDYNKQLQFRALQAESDSRIEVRVRRGGEVVFVNSVEVVVGDIISLETGAIVAADGVLLRSSDLTVNESALTGESDDIAKNEVNSPVILSGAQVASGTGEFVVTAVGPRSMQGSIIEDSDAEEADTPLQVKLGVLASKIGYVGMFVAVTTFLALMIVKGAGGETAKSRDWGAWTISAFIYAVTIIVVAIPEGLPLAVTVSLAYSTRKMLADQNLIRHLAACETMGSATDICTDKTGTLTENRMTIVKFWLGGVEAGVSNDKFDPAVVPTALLSTLCGHLSINSTAVISINKKGVKEIKGSKTEGAGLFFVENLGFAPLSLREAAFQRPTPERSGVQQHQEDLDAPRVIKQFAFSSDRKMMSTLVELRRGGTVRLYTTGGSDFILAICSGVQRLVSGETGGTQTSSSLVVDPLTKATADSITSDVIVAMARQSLRTIGLAYRDFESVAALPEGWQESSGGLERDLTLYGILGIKDPLRENVKESIALVQKAGITVRMVTGDNVITATAIAEECGILRKGGIVLEGPNFRAMTPAQLDELLPVLAVLARSSPKDKNLLVRRLNGNLPKTQAEWEKEHPDHVWADHKNTVLPGYYEEWAAARKHPSGVVYKAVVGVTGDGTNDAPALKAADVGLAMGLSGTQVAQKAADIVILDDRFSSIVKAVMWGRSVYDNVQKFLQFQLTVNAVALLVTFFAAVLQFEPPLNPVMLLWVNLIMDTLGALALGTLPPSEKLLHRRPYSSSTSLVQPRMIRHVAVQAVFQFALLLAILLTGPSWLNVTNEFLDKSGYFVSALYKPADGEDVARYISTFIFNVFVFCQIFNQINARSLTDDWNVYGFGRSSTLFLFITVVEAGLQAILVEFGGPFTKTTGLSPAHWGISIGLAAFTFPLGVVMRFVPVPPKRSDYAAFYQEEFSARMNMRRSQHVVTAVDAVERTAVESTPVDVAPPPTAPTTTAPPGQVGPGGVPPLRKALSFALPPLLPPHAGPESERTAVDMTRVDGAAAPLASDSEKVVAVRPSARLPVDLDDATPKASPHRSNKTVYPVSRERFAAAAQLAATAGGS